MDFIQRWNAKWDNLDVDSDGEDFGAAPVIDHATQEVLKSFPENVAESIARQPDRGKREALLALNCYTSELHGAPSSTPAVQQQLLGAVCDALRGLEEGGEVETLLFRLLEALSHPRVSPQHVEHAVGAMALLQPRLRDPRVTEVILRAGVRRVAEFPASCLARACWAAVALGESDAAASLLNAAMPLAKQRAPDFAGDDVALFAWASAMARPPGAQAALLALLDRARLAAPDSRDGRITAWAVECWGISAAPYFGLPPMTVPSELATGLHHRLRALGTREDTELLHAGEPPLLWVNGLVSPEEAQALLQAGEGRWQQSPVGDGSEPSWRSPDVVVLQTPASSPVPIVERVRRRAASLLGLPEAHCETPQLVRYFWGHRCEEHVDYFLDSRANRGLLYLGGQRVASVIVHLATLPSCSGGETVFPRLGVTAPATLGTALMWLNVREDGSMEEKTVHHEAPIRQDACVKYCLNLWLYAYPVQESAMAQGSIAEPETVPEPCSQAAVVQAAAPATPAAAPLPATLAPTPELEALSPPRADTAGLPAVACPARPLAAPEAPEPEGDQPQQLSERSWEEVGEELQGLVAELDELCDPSVRIAALERMRAGRRRSEELMAQLAAADAADTVAPAAAPSAATAGASSEAPRVATRTTPASIWSTTTAALQVGDGVPVTALAQGPVGPGVQDGPFEAID